DETVPEDMIEAIAETCASPVVVGGGLSTPRHVYDKVRAGASFVVVGNAIEQRPDAGYVAELAAAAHISVARPLCAGIFVIRLIFRHPAEVVGLGSRGEDRYVSPRTRGPCGSLIRPETIPRSRPSGRFLP